MARSSEPVSSRSPCARRKCGEHKAAPRNSTCPVEKLSKPVTSCPSASRRSTRLLPMKPAAPVTRILTSKPRPLVAPAPRPGHAARARPDAENVDRIPQIPAHQRQAAVAIVAPADGHLLNAIAQPASQHQDLHIKHISVDLLPAENLPRRRAREKLEAALRVGNSLEAHHRMHEQPEALAAQLQAKSYFERITYHDRHRQKQNT